MYSSDVQAVIENLFDELSDRHDGADWKDALDGDGDFAECAVTSYADGGYMTRDAGMVLRLADGTEFQITIVQSRLSAREDAEAALEDDA